MIPLFDTVLTNLDDQPFDDQMTMQTNGYYAAVNKASIDFQTADSAEKRAAAEEAKLAAEKLKVELTLGAAARHALCATFPDEKDLTGEQKFDRAMLAYRIKKKEDLDFDPDEISLIKKLIGKLYNQEVLLQAWPLLGYNTKKKKSSG